MSADEVAQNKCRERKEERDHQPGSRDDDAGKSVVIPSDRDPERTLIIGQADAEAILLSRFGWLVRDASPFGGVEPPDGDLTEKKRSGE